MKVKFANTEVHIKKLVQGAVVTEFEGKGKEPSIYHIHRFECFNVEDNSVDLVIADQWGKWSKNSANLIWPI
jgi:hypothetical protein